MRDESTTAAIESAIHAALINITPDTIGPGLHLAGCSACADYIVRGVPEGEARDEAIQHVRDIHMPAVDAAEAIIRHAVAEEIATRLDAGNDVDNPYDYTEDQDFGEAAKIARSIGGTG
jgi:hypothetical protein